PMLESFLVLLAGGIMLAIAIPRPAEVTLQWLRLGGILALTFAGMATFWSHHRMPDHWPAILFVISILPICGQLAVVQVASRLVQRAFAMLAFATCGLCGTVLLLMQSNRAGEVFAAAPLTCIGIAGACGIALMDMLIGHAYLTASRMTMKPFVHLNIALAI